MNEQNAVRLGIIGPSWWVNYWHMAGIRTHPLAEVVAVCGVTDRADVDLKTRYGASAESYRSVEDLLDHADIDGVVVCTPNDLHYPYAMAALNRDIHVLCEKPVAMNSVQAKEMAETARRRHLLGMTNFPYRENPAVQALRRCIKEGYIGKPLHISGSYHGGFGLTNAPNWRSKRARSGAGILGDLGSHLIDLARFVTEDEFHSVCAHSLTLLRDAQSAPSLIRTEDPRAGERNDDSCAFLAEFASGMQGIFHTSWVAFQGAYAQHQEIEIYGTEGRLHFLATHAGTFLRGMKAGQDHWEFLPVKNVVAPESGRGENEDFFRPERNSERNTTYQWIEAIHTGQTSISPDLVAGWQAQKVIDAVIHASSERRWVDISDEELEPLIPDKANSNFD